MNTGLLDKIIEAGQKGGWILALIVAIAALALAWLTFNPVEEVADQISGLASSPADVRCLDGWTETTGKDPDGQIKLKVCTSPDKQIVITVKENEAPVGYDGGQGRFLEPNEIAGFLR